MANKLIKNLANHLDASYNSYLDELFKHKGTMFETPDGICTNNLEIFNLKIITSNTNENDQNHDTSEDMFFCFFLFDENLMVNIFKNSQFTYYAELNGDITNMGENF